MSNPDDDSDDDLPVAATRRHQARTDLIRRGLCETMRSRAGRAWVASILEMTGLDADTFSPDPATACYAQGRRAAGLALIAEIRRAAPDLIPIMIREAQEA